MYPTRDTELHRLACVLMINEKKKKNLGSIIFILTTNCLIINDKDLIASCRH